MALWKEQVAPRKDSAAFGTETGLKNDEAPALEVPAPRHVPTARPVAREGAESILGSELTIEGKIEGAGHIRMEGRFKGDVNVEGNLTIEPGATLTGSVKAHSVVIGGELEGNILDAARVELLQTGILNGDLKAGSLTVAAGSRMRGRAEFGWENGAPDKAASKAPNKLSGEGDNGSL
ncbi:MAG: polymer-forming cytoskeletal protein [Gemmatimonadaceae bacterium]